LKKHVDNFSKPKLEIGKKYVTLNGIKKNLQHLATMFTIFGFQQFFILIF
jgi:hypothetical protein